VARFFVILVQFLVGAGAVLTACQRGPIFYRFTKIPVPHQRLARAEFFVVGATLILGGLCIQVYRSAGASLVMKSSAARNLSSSRQIQATQSRSRDRLPSPRELHTRCATRVAATPTETWTKHALTTSQFAAGDLSNSVARNGNAASPRISRAIPQSSSPRAISATAGILIAWRTPALLRGNSARLVSAASRSTSPEPNTLVTTSVLLLVSQSSATTGRGRDTSGRKCRPWPRAR